MFKIVLLVGNPKPGSRTLRVAHALAVRLMGERPYAIDTIELADHAKELFEWPSATMDRLAAAVVSADAVLVASPTYKATYTGMLKSFLDRFPARGLSGVVAIPVMTGADRGHSMAPDVSLRPLLVELGARVPTQSFYFVTSDIDQLDDIVAAWVENNAATLRSLPRLVCREDAATVSAGVGEGASR
ncbi:NAD(P)H-dependent oxidoreductase [Streptomyces sp. NPDC048275]|uniref:NADPH-dependent FMN reductase n=1 Tax=Streptomyces sp. NPDC048275 TaxID=3155629 RepID=UPI003404F8B0